MSMGTKRLGNTDIVISAMGMGCWAIGGHFLLNGMPDGWGPVDDQVSKAAIDAAYAHGVTFFDTADAYGTGHSEELLGEALKHRRKNVVIATKFGFTYDREQRALTGIDVSPGYIRAACQASLKRLQTDYIDLYQLHVGEISAEQIDSVIETLDRLQEEGWIRSYGWSTYVPENAEIFAKRSRAQAVQFPANVFHPNRPMKTVCETYGLTGVVNAPLAMGLLTGKYSKETMFPADDVRGNAHDWLNYFRDGKPIPEFVDRLESVREILQSGGRTLAQGAICWLWAQSGNYVPIPGIKTPQQAIDNARALEFGPLTPDQLAEIDAIFASLSGDSVEPSAS